MKRYLKLLFFLSCLALIYINLATLKPGHNWGGDFSQYILHARNLAQHQPYNEGIMLQNPVVYPPGFPALIMPVIKYCGIDFVTLKSLNVVCWFLSIVFLYIAMKREDALLATLGSLVLSGSYFFFTFKQNVLSDIPFLLFHNLAIFLFLALDRSKARTTLSKDGLINNHPRNGLFFVLLLTLAVLLLIRSAGVILIFAVIIYLLCVRRAIRMSAAVLILFAGIFAFQTSVIGYQPGFIADVWLEPVVVLREVLGNFSLAFRSLLWFFLPDQTALTKSIYSMLAQVVALSAPVVYGGILIVFIRALLRRKISFLFLYGFIYFSVLIFWGRDPHLPSGFARFVLPLLFPVFVLVVRGVKGLEIKYPGWANKLWSPRRMSAALLLILVTVNIFTIAKHYDFDDDVLLKPENQEMFDWVKDNISMDEHYMIWQARPTALMTGRVGTAPWIEGFQSPLQFGQRIEQLAIQYIITIKMLDVHLMDQLNENPHFVTQVWENEVYRIYKVL